MKKERYIYSVWYRVHFNIYLFIFTDELVSPIFNSSSSSESVYRSHVLSSHLYITLIYSYQITILYSYVLHIPEIGNGTLTERPLVHDFILTVP